MFFQACSVQQTPCPQGSESLISFADLLATAIAAIEPADFLTAYAFGAGSVMTWWGLGFALSVAIKSINKA